MKILRDLWDSALRLTDERLTHILDHPEMSDMEAEIGETLLRPERVARSRSDEEVLLLRDQGRRKILCAVVKFREEDAFVITAYLTDN
ncbi:MAG TPA: hypothetical protein VFI90_20170 [Rubrobacter sp.]|nr:hypothetical protein [Rubrobacter sp.]